MLYSKRFSCSMFITSFLRQETLPTLKETSEARSCKGTVKYDETVYKARFEALPGQIDATISQP